MAISDNLIIMKAATWMYFIHFWSFRLQFLVTSGQRPLHQHGVCAFYSEDKSRTVHQTAAIISDSKMCNSSSWNLRIQRIIEHQKYYTACIASKNFIALNFRDFVQQYCHYTVQNFILWVSEAKEMGHMGSFSLWLELHTVQRHLEIRSLGKYKRVTDFEANRNDLEYSRCTNSFSEGIPLLVIC